jgi:hypothetical protein
MHRNPTNSAQTGRIIGEARTAKAARSHGDEADFLFDAADRRFTHKSAKKKYVEARALALPSRVARPSPRARAPALQPPSTTEVPMNMDRKLVSAQDHEIEYLARKHGTTVEKVKQIIQKTGSRSRKQIEEALDKEFEHHPMGKAKEHAE